MASNPENKPEKLDIGGRSTFPSMLLINKRPCETHPRALAAESVALQKRGQIMMDRLKKFLPEMKNSAEALEESLKSTDNADRFNIESVKEGAPVVEFNLGLFEYSSSESEEELDVLDSSDSDSSDEEIAGKAPDDLISVLSKTSTSGPRQLFG